MTSNTQLRDAAGEADLTFEDPQGPGKRYSRLFGALFLAGFLVYGIGFGLVSSVTTAPDFMSTLAANSTILVIGAFLMLLNTVVDIGKGVLFFPIAERRGKRTALVYLAAITVQVVLLDLGVLFLLMLVPLSEFVAGTAAIEGTAARVAPDAGEYPRLRAWPRHLGVRGLVHDLVPVPDTDGAPDRSRCGASSATRSTSLARSPRSSGSMSGLCCRSHAGLFEVAFGVWLIAKGFNSIVTLPGRGHR